MIVLATGATASLEQYQKYLQPFGMVISVTDYPALRGVMAKIKPRYVFIDAALPGIILSDCIIQMRALSPATKLVGFGQALPEDQEVDLFCLGLRAYCPVDVDVNRFKKMMAALDQGEVWMSRATVARLLAKLQSAPPSPSRQATQVSPEALWTLTQREKEIAFLIAEGKNNRQIAMALHISERTVKAHLTEIFRKLGLNDRLALALRLTAPPSPSKPVQSLAVTKVVIDSDALGLTA